MNHVDYRSKDEILEQVRAEMSAERRAILLNVDADKVASLIPFTKKPNGTTKWGMNAICLEPASAGGLLMIATDGHSIVVRHDPNGLLNTPDAKPLLLTPYAGNTKTVHPVFGGLRTSKSYSNTRLIIRDGQITQEDGRPGSYDIAPLLLKERNFPKWRNILGAFRNAKPYQARSCFQANVLARFDCHPKRSDDQAHAVLLWQEELPDTAIENRPIFVTSPYPDSADMIGALMPVDLRRQADALDLVVPQRRWFIDALAEHQNNGNGNGKPPPQSTRPS